MRRRRLGEDQGRKTIEVVSLEEDIREPALRIIEADEENTKC